MSASALAADHLIQIIGKDGLTAWVR